MISGKRDARKYLLNELAICVQEDRVFGLLDINVLTKKERALCAKEIHWLVRRLILTADKIVTKDASGDAAVDAADTAEAVGE